MECFIDIAKYDERLEVIKKEARPAQKEHYCCECYDVIKIGESYEYFEGELDEEQYIYRTCSVCAEIRKAFFCSFFYEQMWEDLSESEIEITNEHLFNLSGKAQQVIIERLVLDNLDDA